MSKENELEKIGKLQNFLAEKFNLNATLLVSNNYTLNPGKSRVEIKEAPGWKFTDAFSYVVIRNIHRYLSMTLVCASVYGVAAHLEISDGTLKRSSSDLKRLTNSSFGTDGQDSTMLLQSVLADDFIKSMFADLDKDRQRAFVNSLIDYIGLNPEKIDLSYYQQALAEPKNPL